jgi:hypothetical protein
MFRRGVMTPHAGSSRRICTSRQSITYQENGIFSSIVVKKTSLGWSFASLRSFVNVFYIALALLKGSFSPVDAVHINTTLLFLKTSVALLEYQGVQCGIHTACIVGLHPRSPIIFYEEASYLQRESQQTLRSFYLSHMIAAAT